MATLQCLAIGCYRLEGSWRVGGRGKKGRARAGYAAGATLAAAGKDMHQAAPRHILLIQLNCLGQVVSSPCCWWLQVAGVTSVKHVSSCRGVQRGTSSGRAVGAHSRTKSAAHGTLAALTCKLDRFQLCKVARSDGAHHEASRRTRCTL